MVRRFGRAALLVMVACAVNLGLLGVTTVLSQERDRPQDISEPVGVSLVSLKAPEPPKQEEVKDPEPPPPQDKPDFAPDLVAPGLGDFAGPSIGVAINIGGVSRDAARTDFIFDSADLDRAPEVVSRVNPEYPYQARERGIEGYVAVKVLVAADGSVRQLNILKAKPSGVFETAVRKALPGWRFQPGEVGGEPVTAWVTTTLHFRLN
ncbi:MAG: energy transducer TonB [Candidatus Krumholzibacteriia bacterium]